MGLREWLRGLSPSRSVRSFPLYQLYPEEMDILKTRLSEIEVSVTSNKKIPPLVKERVQKQMTAVLRILDGAKV